ncbi:MAG: hypothetical protein JW927_20435 [Deltaproteobacteria bacterium]|nr:hypothetical protein [Deltaproteobacteria bacterium]
MTSNNSPKPSLKIDRPGIYEVELTVNDGVIDSEPDRVLITARKPVQMPWLNLLLTRVMKYLSLA